MPTNKPTLIINIKKTAKRKPGTGMSPGELKAKIGKSVIGKAKKPKSTPFPEKLNNIIKKRLKKIKPKTPKR